MTRTADPRALLGAANNADWNAMMFDVHGLRYERTQRYFRALDVPPPYHSWMTLFAEEVTEELVALVAGEAARPDFSIKDAFVRLDLDALGLQEGFAASWVWADEASVANVDGWIRIDSRALLEQWELAWKSGGSPTDRRQFPAEILERPDVAIFGRKGAEGFDGGAIGNLSPECIGLSNVFGAGAFAAAASLIGRFGDGLPIAGYERGDDLVEALAVGFEVVGQLRVCGRR